MYYHLRKLPWYQKGLSNIDLKPVVDEDLSKYALSSARLRRWGTTMALLETYNINAMATQISRDFYIQDNPTVDKSYILMDEMRLFAMDMKSRVTFISRTKQ